MGFTSPTARSSGYVVQATDWNSDVAYNGAWFGSNIVGANGGKPAVLALETTAQAITNATSTVLLFNDADLYDTQSQHDIATNTGRITCGTGNTGLYHFHASGIWASNATGVRFSFIRLNGTTELYRTSIPVVVATPLGWDVHGYYRMTSATDYVEVLVHQTSGAGLNIDSATVSAKFAAVWISA